MEDTIEELILSLSDRQKVVFAGLVCERLLPQYEAFCAATHWGSPAVFQQGVLLLYNSADGVFATEQARDLLAQLAAVTPRLPDFDHPATAFALDACVALEQGLQFLTDKQESHIVAAATAAAESVELFIQEYLRLDPDRREFARTVAADPFMVAEQARQRRILEALLRVHDFDSAGIQRLRQLNGAGGIIDLARLA